jgi:hypothetical protein
MVMDASEAARKSGDMVHSKELISHREELVARVVDSGHDEGVVAEVRAELRALLLAELDTSAGTANKGEEK